MTYRKIGGIHWLALGRLRISWCLKWDASRDASTSTCASPSRDIVPYQTCIKIPAWDWVDTVGLIGVACLVGSLYLMLS